VVGSKGQICKFLSPFHQFGTGVARNFICGVHIISWDVILRDDKMMSLGAKIVNFGTSFVHLEQV